MPQPPKKRSTLSVTQDSITNVVGLQDPTTINTGDPNQDPNTTDTCTVLAVESVLHDAESTVAMPSSTCKKCQQHIKDKNNLKRRLKRLKRRVVITQEKMKKLKEQASANVSDECIQYATCRGFLIK